MTYGATSRHDDVPDAVLAEEFVAEAEARAAAMNVEQQRALWVAENFITLDTQILAAEANERQIVLGMELAKRAAEFDEVADLPYDLRRKLDLLKLALVTPGPADPRKTAELANLETELNAMYGAAKAGHRDIEQVKHVIETSRDPGELLDVWRGWHAIGAPMRGKYARFVELANEGARDLGYRDAGALWRSKYDMPPAAFAAEIQRLWKQVEPLHRALHCYVRRRLAERYGSRVVARDKPLPAHLLGNLWAQEWGNIADLVAPAGADPGFDLTRILQSRADIDEAGMVRIAEHFFTSIGFDPLPRTFWERSLFVKPRDRDVVCHASAWDIDDFDDVRVKMCIAKNADYFQTIHHELGHTFYQLAYKTQPFLYKNSANDGFHEAVGDTIALSITPGYLVRIGLLDKEPPPSADIPLLLREALDKIAFLPFAVMIDEWRWRVFAGDITPAHYNEAWWELRLKYEGIAPPVERSEADFDAGAKYHIAANVPYARYFLARILQFQFHRALCDAAGETGPLNRCSIYGNKDAGARLAEMLAMGQSRPWPDALEALTGQRQMDATALLDYFAPLSAWLEEQNRGDECG